MERKREEIHTLLTLTQNMEQDNHSPTENVHNVMSGILGQWIRKEKKYVHAIFNTNTYSKHRTRQ